MMLASLDESLVVEARAGSTQAFSRLVDRHQQAVRAFLRRACGDWALADDLAQETFLTAWTRIGRLQTGASVRASAGRTRAREALYEAERPAGSAASHEDRMALEAAMAALPEEQRACVALCLAADFSHAEAAEALEMPLGTVKSHVSRGRARLLQALELSDDES